MNDYFSSHLLKEAYNFIVNNIDNDELMNEEGFIRFFNYLPNLFFNEEFEYSTFKTLFTDLINNNKKFAFTLILKKKCPKKCKNKYSDKEILKKSHLLDKLLEDDKINLDFFLEEEKEFVVVLKEKNKNWKKKLRLIKILIIYFS